MRKKITLPCQDLNPEQPRSPLHEPNDIPMCHRAYMDSEKVLFLLETDCSSYLTRLFCKKTLNINILKETNHLKSDWQP